MIFSFFGRIDEIKMVEDEIGKDVMFLLMYE